MAMQSRHVNIAAIAATLGLVAGFVLGLIVPEWATSFVHGQSQRMITTEDIFFDAKSKCERVRSGGIMRDTPVIVRRHGPGILLSTSYFVLDLYKAPLRPLSDSEKSMRWSELFCETLRDPNSTVFIGHPSGLGEPSAPPQEICQ